MSKNKSADAPADAPEGGAPRRAAKKTVKPPAKKSSARKPEAKKPAGKKRGRPSEPPPAQAQAVPAEAELPVMEPIEAEVTFEAAGPEIAISDEDVIDAEVIAETPAQEAAAELTDEERELSAIYGGDLAAPATAHAEYHDRQTRDEDRPMLPEINAREERKQRWEERRERRKQRRDERDRDRQQRRDQPPQPHGQRPPQPQHADRPPREAIATPTPPPHVNGHAPADGLARVGTPLGDAAATVFAQLRNGQPLPVRQLAAMMRKRNLVQQDPEQLWPQLKAELLGDERSYRTLGLRPRIVYRGRDLFAPGPVAMSATAEAEANVASALSQLASATHRALAARLSRASAAGFERLIHAYLVAAGYREIEWVKRVGGISYAQAIAPGLERPVLISARSGSEPIDRRAIGELRVGVEAKDLVAGILFAARELSEDAERELERAGRSIAVMCGDQLVALLIAAGVGVVSSAAPLHYLDDQLLDELLAG